MRTDLAARWPKLVVLLLVTSNLAACRHAARIDALERELGEIRREVRALPPDLPPDDVGISAPESTPQKGELRTLPDELRMPFADGVDGGRAAQVAELKPFPRDAGKMSKSAP